MKKILALLLSLMLVLSLAACGGDDTTDTTVDEEPAVTDETETPAEDEEVPEGRITDEQLADLTAATTTWLSLTTRSPPPSMKTAG